MSLDRLLDNGDGGRALILGSNAKLPRKHAVDASICGHAGDHGQFLADTGRTNRNGAVRRADEEGS